MLRKQYADSFLAVERPYFRERVQNVQHAAYSGYLWDCVANPEIISADVFLRGLCCYKAAFFMSDCHPAEKAENDVSRDLLSGSVFRARVIDVAAVLGQLPEDLYFFDEDMGWTLIVTHEYVNGIRWCIRATGTQKVGPPIY